MIFIDTETTGLSFKDDHIVEIAAVKTDDSGQVLATFSKVLHSCEDVPKFIEELTGITSNEVRNGEDVGQSLSEFYSFIGNDTLVGHNIVRFDIPFILAEAGRAAVFDKISNPLVDTLVLARKYLPGVPHSLPKLSTMFHFEDRGYHRALADCMSCKDLFFTMRKMLGSSF